MMPDDMSSDADWQTRLDEIYELMREVSRQSDPQEMVRAYGRRMSRLFPTDRRISLSRRDLTVPKFRVTRYSEWEDEVNPWKQKSRLPLLEGGLFAELIYSDQPCIIDHLEVDPDDPAAEYLDGQQSLMAIPMLDQGVSLNMVILTREQPAAFDRERFPDNVWIANLFGRATHNLVLKEQVREAYEMIDHELKIVADIQRSLLPSQLPDIESIEFATDYQTSQRAGGDYYDFFPLPDGKWGILIADVSGHGTPAAVVMAITHSIAHLFPGQSSRAGELLEFVNGHLAARYTNSVGAFVTAFYAIFDPETRRLQYSSAGHNPPRLIRCHTTDAIPLDNAGSFPLGIMRDVDYTEETISLQAGDRLVLYTDGIIEAADSGGTLFGTERLDRVIEQTCDQKPDFVLQKVIDAVNQFTDNAPAADDRTLMVGVVR